MKKLIITLALAASTLTSTAAADPGPNTCHRLRNAIASGTPISTLPPRLVRDCFGDHPSVVVVRPAAATSVQSKPTLGATSRR